MSIKTAIVEEASAPPPGADLDVGVRNGNLANERIRVIEGGGWQKQDVAWILPADKMVAMKCVAAWMHLKGAHNQHLIRLPTDAAVFMLGCEVGDAYSMAVDVVLKHPVMSEFPFILTLESDNIPPQDGLLKLLRHMNMHPEFAAISGLYWTKGKEGIPQIWGDPKDPEYNLRPQPPDPNGGLVECCALGMGFCLWRTEVFRDPRLRRPWFKTDESGTQDAYFWDDARAHGYRCAVACDVPVGHYDVKTNIVW
jgi:hypothetical protein